MLVITETNLEALASPGRQRFEAELCAKLRRFFPGVADGYSDAELEQHCDESRERARVRGLRGAREHSLYIGLELCFGAGFAEREPWAQRALLDPRGVTPTARIDLLWQAGQLELARRQAEEANS